jgi:hypothetical protein
MLTTSARVACLAAACAAASLFGAGCVIHEEGPVDREIVVTREPPPDQSEDSGPAPGTEYAWVRGHWVWNGTDWVWRRGHWEVRRAGYQWVPGHWVQRPAGWVWIEGHWRRL